MKNDLKTQMLNRWNLKNISIIYTAEIGNGGLGM